jgi:TPR repeat protein
LLKVPANNTRIEVQHLAGTLARQKRSGGATIGISGRVGEMARMEMGMDGMELAAQGGAPDALFELGMLYATGLDVEADLVVAHKWFNLAAMRGNTSALARRKELASEMSAGQIAEAQRLAREWLATEKLAVERRAGQQLAIETLAAELTHREKPLSAPAPEWLNEEPLAA